MARILVLCALVACLLHATSAQAVPKWPDAYQASGEIVLPYGKIAEPFTAFVDMTSGQSRMDTYGGEVLLWFEKTIFVHNFVKFNNMMSLQMS